MDLEFPLFILEYTEPCSHVSLAGRAQGQPLGAYCTPYLTKIGCGLFSQSWPHGVVRTFTRRLTEQSSAASSVGQLREADD